MIEPKIALAMIVKGDDSEALVLARCLRTTSRYVDGIFITITNNKGSSPKKVREIAELYGANVSEFDWVDDFAKARNFNFSQVPEEYTHILWADADDIFRGLDKLRNALKENPLVDVFSIFYLYDFDKYRRPTVVHQKTQVVKNNNTVGWAGKLHEDFREIRSIRRMFIKGIERLHLTDVGRIEVARKRNVIVAKKDVNESPDDPRSYWNLGNALFGDGKYVEAKNTLEKFLYLSLSEEEKYTVRLRLAIVESELGNNITAVEHIQRAIGMRPSYPDAYHALANIYFKMGNFTGAAEYFVAGLSKKPPYFEIIAYNPRDYDYNPLIMLANTYVNLHRPDLALVCLESANKFHESDDTLKIALEELKIEKEKLDRVLVFIKRLKDIKDPKKLKEGLKKVPDDLQSHPSICVVRNRTLIKKTSSGKDLVIYCGITSHEWNPDLFLTKGFGGSEEAVINLSEEFSKHGWRVIVYANCGHKPKKYGDVMWKPFWMWNYRDRQDVVILWRSPKAIDYGINAKKICVDVHDMVNPEEFTEERLQHIFKVFVKTSFHRSVFPNIPDDKIAIIPNGMDFKLFKQKIKKDQLLMVNTSSPDRSLDVLPKLFKQIKKKVPTAKLKWAYGWSVFDKVHGEDAQAMSWKQDIVKQMEEAGIENLGRVTQKEAAALYLEANILAYPTEFAEIDCITVKKAQACGALPITTDFGALDESVQWGVKIKSDKTIENWCPNFKFSFGLENKKKQQEWVNACVEHLKMEMEDRRAMKDWAKKFSWSIIAKQWNKVLKTKPIKELL